MIDLSTIPEEIIMARGMYSTVRAKHEDEKKTLSILCGQLSSCATQVLRRMQPDNDDGSPDGVDKLISAGRATLTLMEECAQRIESLAKQRAELKTQAWS